MQVRFELDGRMQDWDVEYDPASFVITLKNKEHKIRLPIHLLPEIAAANED